MEPEAFHEMAQLEGHHWWYVGMREIASALIEGCLNGRRDLRILDAGCGTGGDLTLLEKYGRVQGFDYSPLAVTYSRAIHPGKVIRASVASKPYPANAFDLVTSFDVLVTFEAGDDQVAIAEMARVLRPGGLALIRVAALPLLRGPHDKVVHGVRRYTAEELRAKVTRAGLNVLRLTYANSLLLPLALASRVAQNVSVALGAAPKSDVGESEGLFDGLMLSALRAESRWIGAGRQFPLGVSLIALARKPE